MKHYSIRTEQAYTDWIRRFILYHGKKHQRDMGAAEVGQFLTHLAVQGRVAASTQNQAKSALLFLYKEALEVELPWLENVEQAKAPKRLPIVLNRDETQAILARLSGANWLVAHHTKTTNRLIHVQLPPRKSKGSNPLIFRQCLNPLHSNRFA